MVQISALPAESEHCDFFEGVVMKRAESSYPVQMRTSTEEFRDWMKHRFLT